MSDLPTRTGSAGCAVFVAPLAAGVVGAVAMLFVALFEPPQVFGWVAGGSIFVFFVGTIIAYVATLVLGLPAYFILNKVGISSAFAYVALGLLLGFGFFVLLSGNDLSVQSWQGIGLGITMALCGAATGYAFWRIARPYELHPPKPPRRWSIFDQ